VPILELLVEGFDHIFGNVILEALHANVLDTENSFSRYLVSGIMVGNERIGLTVVLYFIKKLESLR